MLRLWLEYGSVRSDQLDEYLIAVVIIDLDRLAHRPPK